MNRSPVKKGDKLKIYVDGALRGNSGPAANAFLLVHTDTIIHDDCENKLSFEISSKSRLLIGLIF